MTKPTASTACAAFGRGGKRVALQRELLPVVPAVPAHRHKLPDSSYEAMEGEVIQNKTLLKQWTGRACMHFCYPSSAYAIQQSEWLERMGLASSKTSDQGGNPVGTHPRRLRQILDRDNLSDLELEAALSGVTDLLAPFGQSQRRRVNRVRVLWVSHVVPYPPAAGVLLRAYNLIKAIGAQHELTLVAFIQDIWLKTCFGNVERGLDECRRELERHCVSIIFLPIERVRRPAGKLRTALESLITTGGYMQGWLQGPEAHRQFRSLEDEHFDLVHFDTISLAPFAQYFEGTRQH